MSEERKKQPRWVIYLIYLCIVTTLTTTVTLSRYMTSVSGSGTATAAMMTGGMSQLALTIPSMKPGDREVVTFEVVNYTGIGEQQKVSEVSQNYTITLVNTENLPLTYTLIQCENQGNGTGLPINTVLLPNTATTDKGVFPPTVAVTHTYTLEITWIDDGQDNHAYSGKIESIDIRIDAEQEIGK